MINSDKIVNYYDWCPVCMYLNVDESDDPCHECLSTPVNQDSRRPVKFRKKSSIAVSKEVK